MTHGPRWIIGQKGVTDAHNFGPPTLLRSPLYVLRTPDHVNSVFELPLQHDMIKLPGPMYVHSTDLGCEGNGDHCQEVQTAMTSSAEVAMFAIPRGNRNESKRPRCNQTSIQTSRTLLVAYMPRHASKKEVEVIFRNFGIVLSAKIMRDRDRQSKCYGFVKFACHEAAAAALRACAKGHVILEDQDFKAWHLKASWARVE
eukprot:CAMPEP_0172695442 /NCGR_PEP_ID=MMETSP1074-20121228/27361_1 /TAXON_ID=2916 /ORGANISM="Ceratium fusus, Strain PA161109" /LENGTH=199 /DNA_ID=CAMNT_0013516069 /DNA_START=56 /DNA_END=655 /DNA_ORIENTATION=-